MFEITLVSATEKETKYSLTTCNLESQSKVSPLLATSLLLKYQYIP